MSLFEMITLSFVIVGVGCFIWGFAHRKPKVIDIAKGLVGPGAIVTQQVDLHAAVQEGARIGVERMVRQAKSRPYFIHFPVDRTAEAFTPRDYSVFEISNDILLSRFASVLAKGGLCISNTPRGSLRVHEITGWAPPSPMPENVTPMVRT